MGVGDDLAKQVSQQGKSIVKNAAKKAMRALLVNPMFWLVVGITFIIIIVAGMSMDVNSDPEQNTEDMEAVEEEPEEAE